MKNNNEQVNIQFVWIKYLTAYEYNLIISMKSDVL